MVKMVCVHVMEVRGQEGIGSLLPPLTWGVRLPFPAEPAPCLLKVFKGAASLLSSVLVPLSPLGNHPADH